MHKNDKSQTTNLNGQPDEAVDTGRRNLAVTLLGALGAGVALAGCSSENSGVEDALAQGEEPELLSQMLTGTSTLAWVDTILGSPLATPPTARTTGDLATKTSAQLSNATIVVAKGCLAAGDGGGGIFYWAMSGTDDGGTAIVPNGNVGSSGASGCWKRVFEGPLKATWFGLVSNPGSTAQAAANRMALQNAISVALSLKVPLHIPAGTYWLNGTIEIGPGAGLHMSGAGANVQSDTGTRFAWAGPATAQTPMFDLKSVAGSEFRDFCIVCNSSLPLAIGIRAYNAAVSGQPVPGRNTFERIHMQGTNGGLGIGFEFSHYLPGSIDANNENNFFLNCLVTNFTTAGWSFEAGQCKANTMHHCAILGMSSAQSLYGLAVGLAGAYGGSFRWFGGDIGYVGTAFAIGAPGDDMLIHGVQSEGCGHLLSTSFHGAVGPITVQSVRFACNALAADNRIIDFASPGPLHLLSSTFQAAPAGNGYIFAKQAPGNPGQLVAIGNSICTNVEPFQFEGDVRRTLIGNTRSNYGGSTPFYFADVIGTQAGSTRPSSPMIGQTFFDKSLNKPIWCKAIAPSVVWVDAAGTVV